MQLAGRRRSRFWGDRGTCQQQCRGDSIPAECSSIFNIWIHDWRRPGPRRNGHDHCSFFVKVREEDNSFRAVRNLRCLTLFMLEAWGRLIVREHHAMPSFKSAAVVPGQWRLGRFGCRRHPALTYVTPRLLVRLDRSRDGEG